jgi:hypothetical protein
MDAEWAMNVYPELIESPNGRSAMALLGTDGLSVFFDSVGSTAVFGLYTFLGRTFAVVAGPSGVGVSVNLLEIFADGSGVVRGNLPPNIGAPVIWAANPTQLMFLVTNPGALFVYTLATNTLNLVNLSAGPASSIGYLDGFFVALIANSNQFMVSNPEDGSNWPAINTATISEFPDNAVGMVITDRIITFFGQKASVPYYNAGALFPFIPVPNVLVQEGAIATYAMNRLDNTVLWIGGNVDEGSGIAFRANGYTPTRISNHSIETIWQSYPTIADAISYTYQSRGHKFWHIYFPTANASWRYDIATGSWHQVGTWNGKTGQFNAHRSQCHTTNFGLHLVGDPFSGNIYSMSPANLTDNGTPIRRIRRAPYLAKEHEWMFHTKFELLAEMGLPSQIKAPSKNPGFLNLADANGALWTVTISDAGAITVAAAAAGQVATPGMVVLADNMNQATFWQLVVSVGGALSGTRVQFGSATVANYFMGTVPTLPNTMPQDTALQVNPAGVVNALQPQPHLREPLVLLRWSDDGGHTWSNYYEQGLGLTGNYLKRAIWRRLGRSRNRIYEISCDDPVALRIVDAYVNDPGQAQERLNDKLRAMA